MTPNMGSDYYTPIQDKAPVSHNSTTSKKKSFHIPREFAGDYNMTTANVPIRKNVSFGTTRIASVPSLDDFSRADKQATWYSVQDLGEFRSRERRIKKNSASLRDALRNEIGLESSSERLRRRARVESRLHSVLDEQDRQWDDDSTDPERLARVSSATSVESMNIALEKAKNVAKQVVVVSPIPAASSTTPPLTRFGRTSAALRSISPMRMSSSPKLRGMKKPLPMQSSSPNIRDVAVATGSSNAQSSNAAWKVQPQSLQVDMVSPSTITTPHMDATSPRRVLSRRLQHPMDAAFGSLSSSSATKNKKNSNQRWQVTKTPQDSVLSPPQRPKYNLKKLAGLVATTPNKTTVTAPVQS